MEQNLLVTKIIVPTRRTDMLRRQRLLDFLHAYLDRKLLLVSASAGYGKTSVLVDFAHDTELPVCWYSLDAGDTDPLVFLEYLVASIQRCFPRFGGRITALLRQADLAANPDACVGALITDIQQEIDAFFVLVLDDYHLVEAGAAVNQLLDRLLQYLPENAHVILASRTVPSGLTLTRLTARQQVAGLGVNDLRFTADEIRALVETKFDLPVSSEAAEALARQSEGWIAGLVLTTPTLWRGVFQEWVQTAGPGSQLFDYLASEVLAQQPPELEQFLLGTSVLQEMQAEHCNELLGRTDAQALLLLAERRNLFITRLEDFGYRYHHLFREFLLTRLREMHPARLQELQERAAALCERRGNMDRAVTYWLAARQTDDAARVLDMIAPEYYEGGRWTTLARWLDALGDAALEKFPALLLYRAMLQGEAGALSEAQILLVRARAEFEWRGDTVAVAHTWIQAARYETDSAAALGMCENALAILSEHDFEWQALARHTMGLIHARQSAWSQAMELLEGASALYEIANRRARQASVENDLGAAYLAIGNRTRAETHFKNALQHAQRLGSAAKLANALNSIAVTKYQQGALNEAFPLLQDALKHARTSGHLRIEAYVRASLGDVRRDRGEWADALEDFGAASEIAEKIRDRYMVTFARVAIGDIWRLCGDSVTAERVLENAMQIASAHHSAYNVALVQLSLGALKLAQGEPDAAQRHLAHALPLLERSNAPRETARAHFYLAHAAILRKQEKPARQHARALARLGKELNEDQFLWADAVHERQVLEFALNRHIGMIYFQELLRRIEQSAMQAAPMRISDEAAAPVEIYTLGEASVVVNGLTAVFPTATTKELYLFFALNPQGWRKEEVIEKLWTHASLGQGSDLLHSSVYRLRRAVSADALVYRNGIYQINPETVLRIDAAEFKALLTQAHAAQDERISLLERAVALYRGDFMCEFYSDWCAPMRDRLRALFLDALSQLGQAYAHAGDSIRAQKAYETLLGHDALHEGAYRGLIELYALTGNRPAAVQVYRQCVEILSKELGVPPMPETIEAYRQVLVER